ncbi:hypothetical protein [Rhizobium leguminosarum]|uniref:hypothetical protein n=1 Tax=Rhizobium leguminosarum TaxID=384 RepID=UPI0003F98BF5|nr:hypothetical protein [Rhizobium leguminosarum]
MRMGAFAIACVVGWSCGTSAFTFELNPTATARMEAEVGLDDKTIAFLNRLPAELRKQFVQMLKESLPLIDSSVQSYISQIDDVISSNIDQAACSATIPVNVFFDRATELVLPGDYKSKPVATLTKDLAEVVNGFSSGNPPSEFRIAYSDFLHRAATTACQVGLSAPTLLDIAGLQKAARPKWRVWSRLEGECQNADECMTWLRTTVMERVSQADSRDVALVTADTRFDKVEMPEELGFFEKLSGKFHPAPYEDAFVELFSITDGIRVAKKLRQASAEADFAAGVALINEAETKLTKAKKQLSNLDPSKNNLAISNAKAVSKVGVVVATAFANAKDAWPEIDERIEPEIVRYDELVKGASSAIKSAKANNTQINHRDIARDILRILQ